MILSVCIITFNEDKIIARTLDSVKGIADEIVIVDSFSKDNTKEIVKSYGNINFIENAFEGFGSQKQFALSHCTGDWILFIDADEILDEECQNSILDIKQNGPLFKVYEIEFENYIFNRRIKRGGWNNVKRIKFFAKGVVHFSSDIVHENIVTAEKVGLLKGKIQHFTYHDISHHIHKMNSYSELMAVKKLAQGKTKSLFSIFVSPFFCFIKNYFFKLGFLDGYLGLYAAFVGAFYTFMKYGKLRQKVNNLKK